MRFEISRFQARRHDQSRPHLLAPLQLPTSPPARPLLLPALLQTRYPLPADLKGLPLVALFNAGTLQDSIPAGPVTVGKLQGALPYSVDG